MRPRPATDPPERAALRPVLLLALVAGVLAALAVAAAATDQALGLPGRTAMILGLGAAVACTFAASEALAGVWPAARGSWRFPVTAALAWLVLHAGFRLVADASLVPGQGRVPGFGTGILFNPRDNLSYLSWAVQARDGTSLFQNLLTFEEQDGCYFNPFFWIVGWTARLTGTSHFLVYHLAGILGALATILLTYRLAHAAGLGEAAARWATLLVAFASGASAAVRAVAQPLGWQPGFGADVRYQDAIPAATFFAYPYHSFTLALLAATMLAVLRAESCPRLSAPRGILVVALAALLSVTHPYEGVMVVGTYGLTALLTLMLPGAAALRTRRVLLASLLAVAALPGLGYAAWISSRPLWSTFAEESLDLPRTRLFWIVGYGLLLPASLWGCTRVLRGPRSSRGVWPALWVLSLVVFLVVLDVAQSKVCNGGGLSVALLAGAGLADLARRGLSGGLVRRMVAWPMLAATAGVLLSTLAYLLGARYGNQYCDAGLVQLAAQLRPDTSAPFPVVLCEVEAARALPALAGVKVFAGHWSLTPDYAARLQRLREAGIESTLPTEVPGNVAAFESLVAECRPRFVVLRDESPARAWMPQQTAFRQVASSGAWTLFESSAAPGGPP